MGEYWENATMEIREKLEDPLLKVEVEATYKKNPETGLYERKHKYEILKWFESGDYIRFMDGGELVTLVYSTGWWAYQMGFDAWDGRVEKAMIAGRLKGRREEIKRRELEEVERQRREESEEAGAIGREMGHDLYHKWHPRMISTPC